MDLVGFVSIFLCLAMLSVGNRYLHVFLSILKYILLALYFGLYTSKNVELCDNSVDYNEI